MEIILKIELGTETKGFINQALEKIIVGATPSAKPEVKDDSKKISPKPATMKNEKPKTESKKDEVKPETAASTENNAISLDDVRGYTANLLKSNPAFKVEVSELLAKYDVKKVSDLAVENFEAFLNDVKALEEDVI